MAVDNTAKTNATGNKNKPTNAGKVAATVKVNTKAVFTKAPKIHKGEIYHSDMAEAILGAQSFLTLTDTTSPEHTNNHSQQSSTNLPTDNPKKHTYFAVAWNTKLT